MLDAFLLTINVLLLIAPLIATFNIRERVGTRFGRVPGWLAAITLLVGAYAAEWGLYHTIGLPAWMRWLVG